MKSLVIFFYFFLYLAFTPYMFDFFYCIYLEIQKFKNVCQLKTLEETWFFIILSLYQIRCVTRALFKVPFFLYFSINDFLNIEFERINIVIVNTLNFLTTQLIDFLALALKKFCTE